MKKLLIISPHFPPVNAADMHRVRQSLPYFEQYGWKPTVIAVSPHYVETATDPLLADSVSSSEEIVHVKAFSTRLTRKLGLGSLGLRSLWFYFKVVNRLLKQQKYDLIYFSTTMFPVTILGAYWKKRFKVPYIIDMQDPWFSDYYLSKPKHERPPKFWFSYRLNKYLEPIAMHSVDGIIAVSDAYCKQLQKRYSNIKPPNCATITFGAFEKDFDVLKHHQIKNHLFDPTDGNIHIPYIGRAGHDMRIALRSIFLALKKGLQEQPQLFEKIRMYFIGTSYASEGKGTPTVMPIAREAGVENYVQEHTDRIPYYVSLKLLQDAHMLIIPGSDDYRYTASKLYNYILAQKPLLTVFHEQSSVNRILCKTKAGMAITFAGNTNSTDMYLSGKVYLAWGDILQKLPFIPNTDWGAFQPYTAEEMTKKQVNHFNKIAKL